MGKGLGAIWPTIIYNTLDCFTHKFRRPDFNVWTNFMSNGIFLLGLPITANLWLLLEHLNPNWHVLSFVQIHTKVHHPLCTFFSKIILQLWVWWQLVLLRKVKSLGRNTFILYKFRSLILAVTSDLILPLVFTVCGRACLLRPAAFTHPCGAVLGSAIYMCS